MSTSLMPIPKVQFFTDTGLPLAGGLVYTYEPGTVNPKASYTDSTGAVANANPVVLDSAGRASIWLSGFYDIRVETSAGVLVYSVPNVSSMSASAATSSQWIAQSFALTYIGATQFSVPGDQTATFPEGTRIQCSVTAGTITGTVTASSAGGSPVATTVTVVWDSGSLDAGLSSLSTGIVTVTTSSHPIPPVLAKTASYVLTILDINKIVTMDAATAQSFTLPAASGVSSGSWYRVKNLGVGTLTITGTVDGLVNTTLARWGEVLIFSDGTAWYGKRIRDDFYGIASFENLRIITRSAAPNTSLDVTADKVVLNNTASAISVLITSLSAVANIAQTVGTAGGLDTGAEAISTWYHIWAIATADLTASVLLSASTSAPTLPAGYVYKGYLGAVYNDSGSNFDVINQTNNKVSIDNVVASAGGSATSYTTVSLASIVPLTAKRVGGIMSQNTSAEYTYVAPSALGEGVNYARNGAGLLHSRFSIPLHTPQTMFYKVSGGNMDVIVTGFEY